jgi:hypothetical protein
MFLRLSDPGSEVISDADRNVIRDLTKRVADMAALPTQTERRNLWGQAQQA